VAREISVKKRMGGGEMKEEREEGRRKEGEVELDTSFLSFPFSALVRSREVSFF